MLLFVWDLICLRLVCFGFVVYFLVGVIVVVFFVGFLFCFVHCLNFLQFWYGETS